MNKEINNEPNWQELLREHQMPPSPSVWERIESAQPTPLAVPKAGKSWMWWSAAAFMVVSLVAGYFLLMSPENDAPETLELFVPVSSDGSPESSVNDESMASDGTSHYPTETMNTGDVFTASDASPLRETGTPGFDVPTGANTTVATTVNTESVSIPQEILPQIKPVNIPEPKQVTLQNPATGNNQADAGKSTEEPITQPTSAERLKVFIPNAFTPGSNGMNHLFRPVIQNNEPVFDYNMQIFARSGQLLFESTNIDEGWNGLFRGVPVEERVCVYDISFRDKAGNPYRKWGTVVVLKQGM